VSASDSSSPVPTDGSAAGRQRVRRPGDRSAPPHLDGRVPGCRVPAVVSEAGLNRRYELQRTGDGDTDLTSCLPAVAAAAIGSAVEGSRHEQGRSPSPTGAGVHNSRQDSAEEDTLAESRRKSKLAVPSVRSASLPLLERALVEFGSGRDPSRASRMFAGGESGLRPAQTDRGGHLTGGTGKHGSATCPPGCLASQRGWRGPG
jgi:hypothetical protein